MVMNTVNSLHASHSEAKWQLYQLMPQSTYYALCQDGTDSERFVHLFQAALTRTPSEQRSYVRHGLYHIPPLDATPVITVCAPTAVVRVVARLETDRPGLGLAGAWSITGEANKPMVFADSVMRIVSAMQAMYLIKLELCRSGYERRRKNWHARRTQQEILDELAKFWGDPDAHLWESRIQTEIKAYTGKGKTLVETDSPVVAVSGAPAPAASAADVNMNADAPKIGAIAFQ